MDIGTATVKVIPDLDEFNEVMAAIPKIGLTIREQIDYERDAGGAVVRTVRTTSVVRRRPRRVARYRRRDRARKNPPGSLTPLR